MTPTSGSPWGDDPTRRTGDDLPPSAFEDDIEGDGFDDDPFGLHTAPAADEGGLDAASEGVLDYEDDENVPNAYNVRNIVLIATGGFVLVLVVFLFSLGGGPSDPAELARLQAEAEAQAQGVPSTADASALDLSYGQAPPADGDLQDLLNDPSLADPSYASASYAPPPSAPSGYQSDYYDDPPPSTSASPSMASGPREPTYLEARRDQFLSALGLGSRRNVAEQPAGTAYAYGYGGDAVPSYASGEQGYSPEMTAMEAQMMAYTQQAMAAAGGGSPVQQASQTSASDRRRTGGPPAGFQQGGGARQASVRAQNAFAPFVLPQGTLVPVTLETSVNSDIPGVMIARTSSDVLDRTRRHVLIPRGSQIVSNYSSNGVTGDRLQVSVSRLNLSDGRSVDFSGSQMHDAQGGRGLKDQVVRHVLPKLGAGAALAVGGLAGGIANRRDRTLILTNPDGSQSVLPSSSEVGYEAAGGAARGAERAIEAATRPALTRPNTIVLRPGLQAMIVLTEDIDMVQPYFSTGGPVATGASPHDTRPSPVRGLRRATVPGRPNVPPPPPVRTITRTVSRR